MKILVTAGGTGGHIYPALALIDKFKSHDKDTKVIYVGTKNRMEKDIVPKLGIEYHAIEIYGLTKNIINDIKDVYLIIKDIKEMKKLMKKFKPDVVLAIGGYVTYPVIKAAHSLHIPIFIHEQNSIVGKANKLTAKYADLIGVSFEESIKYFKNKNVFYSGNPTAERALSTPKIDKQSIGLDNNKKLVVVVAGSLGSRTMSNKMKEYLKNVKGKNYQILYITGKVIYDEFIKDEYPSNVKIVPYFDNLPGILKSADLLISRAGASTIAEIECLKIPSILIPSPYVANNHQYYNALSLKKANAAELIEEDNLNVDILNKLVEKMLDDSSSYKVALSKLSKIDSSETIYQKIKEMLNNVK
ncbi:MAG: undecaprenyldiphospho-muramoylpentapeptide beta-N-acetylglucosaminyltransferase [Bacilli bacterium]|nr:undecaprenyldiphospho-muramoylpentapeptide beta-N-acetylglucosaminyltransferase [Bacilli bacterium]